MIAITCTKMNIPEPASTILLFSSDRYFEIKVRLMVLGITAILTICSTDTACVNLGKNVGKTNGLNVMPSTARIMDTNTAPFFRFFVELPLDSCGRINL
jgi:hypothetical protein